MDHDRDSRAAQEASRPGRARPPVVLQVIPRLGAGGAEQGCIDMAGALTRAGAVSIVAAHGGERVHELKRAGAEYVDLPVDSKNPVVMLRNARALRRLIDERGVDIVHARSRAPAWSCLAACRGGKARFMTTCHAPYNVSGRAKAFYNSSIARGERIIAISHYVARYLEKFYGAGPERVRVVPRGIALEKFNPAAVGPERLIRLSGQWRAPDGAQIVLMPGRLTRWKGHAVVIEAVRLMQREDVFCVFPGADQGRDAYREELEAAIEAAGLSARVRIAGHCDDMPAAYMLAAVVVSASTDPEGFGRVPVEAQAMGRPCIATDHGGARETIVPGETGWLTPPGDAKALAAAISEALSLGHEARTVMAARAMDHVARHFSRERMTDATLSVYAELLETGR